MKVNCFIFTALPCEAKPFIAHFKLKKSQTPQPFSIYTGERQVLVVAGSGKISMAAAVAYALAKFPAIENPVLINAGIAGHQTAALGELFNAHKITDADSGKNFYPQLITKNTCPSLPVYTVSKPETQYQNDCLYEMEASGFFEIATRFTTAELIQVFKVVSDNQISGIEGINAKKVTEWLALQVEEIAAMIQPLQTLADEQSQSTQRYYADLLERYHFTVSSQHQLKAQLQRWDVLTNHAELDFSTHEFRNGKAVLQWLNKQIESQTFKL
ncbi:MAG: hypothetical protein GQ569_03115 [Methylococcaceae bacterium]|nr:hypothetical protein [Methylococcaceae bacterium]